MALCASSCSVSLMFTEHDGTIHTIQCSFPILISHFSMFVFSPTIFLVAALALTIPYSTIVVRVYSAALLCSPLYATINGGLPSQCICFLSMTHYITYLNDQSYIVSRHFHLNMNKKF